MLCCCALTVFSLINGSFLTAMTTCASFHVFARRIFGAMTDSSYIMIASPTLWSLSCTFDSIRSTHFLTSRTHASHSGSG
ncbi:uncharacterized protein HD556DRAFT_1353873, partial [Suillus plorans]